MKERIKTIMQDGGYTPVTFAAHIGINPMTMTANLNRNAQVSASILMAILEKYGNINADWLLFGKGPMYKDADGTVGRSSQHNDTSEHREQSGFSPDYDPRQLPLFPEQTPVSAPQRQQTPEYRKETPDKPLEKTPEIIKYQEVIVEKIVAKKVNKIIVYYADNTFDSFCPEQ
ncbi:transcriptional regulator [Bacteroidia bacterium]|nr:transcriptional regulator [Bacteroidia bacterium]